MLRLPGCAAEFGGHKEHVVDASLGVYVSRGQLVQASVSPSDTLNLPFSQALHMPSSCRKAPALHQHALEPGEERDRDGHGEQTVAPSTLTNICAGHTRQDELSIAFLWWPKSQTLHSRLLYGADPMPQVLEIDSTETGIWFCVAYSCNAAGVTDEIICGAVERATVTLKVNEVVEPEVFDTRAVADRSPCLRTLVERRVEKPDIIDRSTEDDGKFASQAIPAISLDWDSLRLVSLIYAMPTPSTATASDWQDADVLS